MERLKSVCTLSKFRLVRKLTSLRNLGYGFITRTLNSFSPLTKLAPNPCAWYVSVNTNSLLVNYGFRFRQTSSRFSASKFARDGLSQERSGADEPSWSALIALARRTIVCRYPRPISIPRLFIMGKTRPSSLSVNGNSLGPTRSRRSCINFYGFRSK